MTTGYDERDVTFDIIEDIGVISTKDTGWTKELNLVKWNGGLAKYDIREWDPSHERMSRGITLHEEEMRRILELMKRRRSKSRNRPASSYEGILADKPETKDGAGSLKTECNADSPGTEAAADSPASEGSSFF